MVHWKKSAKLWTAAGLLLSLLVLLVVSGGLAGKVFVTDPEGIPQAAEAVMNCIRTGAWTDLELLVSGGPSLDLMTGKEDTAEGLIWNAYQQSLQWVCEEGYDVREARVTQQVTVTCLDINGVTNAIVQIVPEPAYSVSGSQDQRQALRSAAQQVLNSSPPTMQRTVTLTFVRENGQWRVIPNHALLALLSGFTAP